MQRNKYYEREKEWLAVQRRADELQPYKDGGHWSRRRRHGWMLEPGTEYILWEPLEKPVFAGWDMWVTLGEPGLRRRDAARMLDVLRYLGADKPAFIREVKYLRLARRAGYRYPAVEIAWTPPGGKPYIYYPLGHLFNRKVDEKTYMSMPVDIKCYFERSARYNRWSGKDDIEYHLGWRFPTYELVVKTRKAYNTHIGHLYGDQIGEYEKLNAWLYHESQMSAYASIYGKIGRYRDCFHRGIKTRWASACKELRGIVHSLSEECADEFEMHVERKYHLHNKKKYGYS